jgi:hypothetical protein
LHRAGFRILQKRTSLMCFCSRCDKSSSSPGNHRQHARGVGSPDGDKLHQLDPMQGRQIRHRCLAPCVWKNQRGKDKHEGETFMRPNACAAYEETLVRKAFLLVSPRCGVNFRRSLFPAKRSPFWGNLRDLVTFCDTVHHFSLATEVRKPSLVDYKPVCR